jgi:hypothetical protein
VAAKADEHNAVTEGRIEHICKMMRTLRWRRGETVTVLAVEWDLSEKRIRELSAEASKRVRAEIMDPDEVSATVGAAVAEVLQRSLADDDRKSAIDAAKAWADISGAKAPQRVEATVTSTTPAEARRVMAEVFGSVGPDTEPPKE